MYRQNRVLSPTRGRCAPRSASESTTGPSERGRSVGGSEIGTLVEPVERKRFRGDRQNAGVEEFVDETLGVTLTSLSPRSPQRSRRRGTCTINGGPGRASSLEEKVGPGRALSGADVSEVPACLPAWRAGLRRRVGRSLLSRQLRRYSCRASSFASGEVLPGILVDRASVSCLLERCGFRNGLAPKALRQKAANLPTRLGGRGRNQGEVPYQR